MTNETTLPELPVAAYSNNYATYWTKAQMHAYAQQATADLRAELEHCRADAERYRHLRAHRFDFFVRNNGEEIRLHLPRGASALSDDALDAAIDAARGAK